MSSPHACLYSALFARFLPHTPVRQWLLGTPQSHPGSAAAPPLLDRSVAFVCDFPIPSDLSRLTASFALGELMIPVSVYGNFVLGYILDAEAVHKTLALTTGRKFVVDNPVVARRCVVHIGSHSDRLSLLDFCFFKDRSLTVTAKQFPSPNSNLPIHSVLVHYPSYKNLDYHDLIVEFFEKRHTLTSLPPPIPQPDRALRIARRATRYTKYSQVQLPVSCATTQSALPVLHRVLTTCNTVRVRASFVIKVMAHDARYGPIGTPTVRDLQAHFHIANDSQMNELRQVASLTASFNQPTASSIINHPLANHHNAPDDAHAADILAELSAHEPVQHKSSLIPHPHHPQVSYATTQPISSPSSAQPVYSTTTTSAQPIYSTNSSANLPFSHPTIHVTTVDATKPSPASIAYSFDYSPVSATTSTSPPLVPELPQLGAPPSASTQARPPSVPTSAHLGVSPIPPSAPTQTQLGVTPVPASAPTPVQLGVSPVPLPPSTAAVPPPPNSHPTVSLPLSVGVPYSLPAPSALHAPLTTTAPTTNGSAAVPTPALGGERGIFDKFFPASTGTAAAPISMTPSKRVRGGAAVGGKGVCSECGKCFFKSGALQRHMQKAHAGAARLPTASLGVERLECPKCDKTFSQQGSLNRHLRSIHEARKLHCRYCSLSFGQAFDLKRHQRRKHPNDALFVPREALPAMVRHNRRVVRQPSI